MAGTSPHTIHIGMRKLHDEQEDAYKDKEEGSPRKKTEETLKIIMHSLRQYNYLKHTKPEIIKSFNVLMQISSMQVPESPW